MLAGVMVEAERTAKAKSAPRGVDAPSMAWLPVRPRRVMTVSTQG
jgi:hypothetical protein